MREIAKIDGVSPMAVSRRAKKYGIEPKYIFRAKHCVLSPGLRELLDGLLLGGGSLVSHHPKKKTYFFTQASTKLPYIKWIAEQLNKSGIEPQGKIVPMTENRFHQRSQYWRYTSWAYYELTEIWFRWYRKGKKEVPPDLKLTPTIALLWYLRGGYLGKGNKIRFAVTRYSSQSFQRLRQELRRIGCQSRLYLHSKKVIELPSVDSKRFLDYIGPCPKKLQKVLGYKWRIDKKR